MIGDKNSQPPDERSLVKLYAELTGASESASRSVVMFTENHELERAESSAAGRDRGLHNGDSESSGAAEELP
jgi:hypothetical protein